MHALLVLWGRSAATWSLPQQAEAVGAQRGTGTENQWHEVKSKGQSVNVRRAGGLLQVCEQGRRNLEAWKSFRVCMKCLSGLSVTHACPGTKMNDTLHSTLQLTVMSSDGSSAHWRLTFSDKKADCDPLHLAALSATQLESVELHSHLLFNV